MDQVVENGAGRREWGDLGLLWVAWRPSQGSYSVDDSGFVLVLGLLETNLLIKKIETQRLKIIKILYSIVF